MTRLVTALRVVVGLLILGGVASASLWVTRSRAGAPAVTRPTVSVPVYPVATAVDDRTQRVFVASNVNDSGAVSILDAQTGSLLGTALRGVPVTALVVDKQMGRVFVTHGGSRVNLTGRGAISMLDARSGALLRTVRVRGSPFVLLVDERSRRIFAADEDGQVTVLDARTGAIVRSVVVGTRQGGSNAAVGVDERRGHVFIGLTGDDSVSMLDATSGRRVHRITAGQAPWAIVIDEPTAHAFVVNQASNDVSMLDTRTGTLLRTIAVGLSPIAAAVDARTGRVFVVNVNHGNVVNTGKGGTAPFGTVSVLDARRGHLLRMVRVGFQPGAVSVAESSRRVFVVSATTVNVLDAGSGALLRTIPLLDAASTDAPLGVDERWGHLFVGLEPVPPTPHVTFIDGVLAVLGRLVGQRSNVRPAYTPGSNSWRVVMLDSRE